MLWHRVRILISFIFFVARCMGSATTTAVCTTAEWTFSQRGMSPCLVAANLEAVCNGGDWNIPALPPASDYSGPTSHQATECTCSTVTYSLVAACSVCQQREHTTWSDWRKNCSDHDVSIALYPLTLPDGVSVPAWAYLNVTTSNTFDPNAALSVHDSGVPDVGSGNSTSVTPPPVSTTSHSNRHLGPIIGGVVGGAVFLILVSFAAYYCTRRRTRKDHYGSEKMDMAASPAPLNPAFSTLLVPPPSHELKLYDPTDPSTFPMSPVPTYRSSEVPVNTYGPSTGDDFSSSHPFMGNNHGQYTGVPEV